MHLLTDIFLGLSSSLQVSLVLEYGAQGWREALHSVQAALSQQRFHLGDHKHKPSPRTFLHVFFHCTCTMLQCDQELL